MIGFVKLRILEPDDQCVLRGDRLKDRASNEGSRRFHNEHWLKAPTSVFKFKTLSKFRKIWY